METENFFTVSRDSFETALTELETFHHQNEIRLRRFMARQNRENPKLNKNCNEWVHDTRKALSDYRALVLRGLDYMATLNESRE